MRLEFTSLSQERRCLVGKEAMNVSATDRTDINTPIPSTSWTVTRDLYIWLRVWLRLFNSWSEMRDLQLWYEIGLTKSRSQKSYS